MTTILDRFLRTTRYVGHVRPWQSVPEIATADDEPEEREPDAEQGHSHGAGGT